MSHLTEEMSSITEDRLQEIGALSCKVLQKMAEYAEMKNEDFEDYYCYTIAGSYYMEDEEDEEWQTFAGWMHDETGLEMCGIGRYRIAFCLLGADWVVKIPYNDSGEGQNNAEIDYAKTSRRKTFLKPRFSFLFQNLDEGKWTGMVFPHVEVYNDWDSCDTLPHGMPVCGRERARLSRMVGFLKWSYSDSHNQNIGFMKNDGKIVPVIIDYGTMVTES